MEFRGASTCFACLYFFSYFSVFFIFLLQEVRIASYTGQLVWMDPTVVACPTSALLYSSSSSYSLRFYNTSFSLTARARSLASPLLILILIFLILITYTLLQLLLPVILLILLLPPHSPLSPLSPPNKRLLSDTSNCHTLIPSVVFPAESYILLTPDVFLPT